MAKNFCIYCGKPLTPGIECSCRTGGVTAPAYDDSTPAYAMDISAYTAVAEEPAAESVPSKFCIYCGTPLAPGVECSCRAVAPKPVYEESTPVYEEVTPAEPEPVYEESAPVYREAEVIPAEASYPKFCTRCGKPLAPGEVCGCTPSVATAPTYEIPNPGAVYTGVKTTMRTESKPETTPVSNSPYLSRPTDLD